MRGERHKPAWILPGSAAWFPDPAFADREGLVAVGGDLSQARLLCAYEQGLFPWYDSGIPPLWWSPDPRCLLDTERLHVSRSMERVLGQKDFVVTWDQAFTEVMEECGRRPDTGTWILPEMVTAYTDLHDSGHAHSIEVWREGKLVGGLYGVQRGAFFAAESMFHRVSNASKVALIVVVRSLFRAGIELFDVQFPTSHLTSLGAYSIPRSHYLARLHAATHRPVSLAQLALDF